MSNHPLSKIIRGFRAMLRPLIQGPLLERWLDLTTTVLGRRFVRKSVRIAQRSFPAPPPAIAPSRKLQRLLFICANMWEKRELVPELSKICTVDFLDVRPQTVFTNNAEHLDFAAFEKLAGNLQKQAYDLTIVYLQSSLLSATLFDYLRSHWACPVVGLNLDDKTSFEHLDLLRQSAPPYREWAKFFDCNLTNSKLMIDAYHQAGFPCLYLPTGFHLRQNSLGTNEEPFKYQTTFVGSRKPERYRFIEQARKFGIPITVFGGGWKGSSFTNDGAGVYRTSQINLGIGYNIPGTQITNLKNRDFECPGEGGCYLTTFDWELAELFEVGKEILCYRDINEFAEVWSYYVRRPERCRAIGQAGRLRAVREHTWEKRFRAVFAQLGLTTTEIR